MGACTSSSRSSAPRMPTSPGTSCAPPAHRRPRSCDAHFERDAKPTAFDPAAFETLWNDHWKAATETAANAPKYHTAVKAPIRGPDGWPDHLEDALQLFQIAGVAFFETEDDWRNRPLEGDRQFYVDFDKISAHRLLWHDKDKGIPKQVYFETDTQYSERGTWRVKREHNLVFDEQGRVTEAWTRTDDEDVMQTQHRTVARLSHDAEGRVDRIDLISQTYSIDPGGGIANHTQQWRLSAK